MPEPVPLDYITSAETAANPHPWSAALRERGPVHRIDFPPGADAYIVVDYAHVSAAFNDPRLSKRLDAGPEWFRNRLQGNTPVLTRNMLSADPPEHTRLRRLVSRAFTPRRIEGLRPRIQQVVNDLIDDFPAPGELDLMRAFALPLPLTVICEFLGVPVADHPRFEAWGRVLSQSGYAEGPEAARRQAVSDEVDAYLTEVLAARRAEPRGDLISELLRAAEREGTFTDEEIVSTTIFLIIAGHKTTANLLGNGTLTLLRNPDQLQRLRAEPSLVPSSVEEFLRYEGPVERGTLRFATEDVRLGGVDIPKGSFVHLSVGAAARDPAVFDRPDQFEPGREPNPHLTFGYGAHFCAGAPLARLEGEVAFRTLLRRLPDLELAVAPDALRWVADSSISRGLAGLPVRVQERRPR